MDRCSRQGRKGRPGMSSGYIEYGTMAHKILVMMHQLGDICYAEIVEQLQTERRTDFSHIAITLRRLTYYGFIYKKARVSKYISGQQRSQWHYTLEKPKRVPTWKPKTSAERTRHYRNRQSRKFRGVASVFDLARVYAPKSNQG